MKVRPSDHPGEEGYWIVELGPMTTDEVLAIREQLEGDGWTITDEQLPSEFHRITDAEWDALPAATRDALDPGSVE